MRPLHRPMFRYGGPIKEGVMSGIREPRANGGSMRNRALLVGNPAFPMRDGRAMYAEQLSLFDTVSINSFANLSLLSSISIKDICIFLN